MAATIPVRSIRAGSYWTVARSVARFTFASATPSARDRYRSMRFTQLAQVIPTTGRVNSVGEAELVLTVPTGYYRGVCWAASRASTPPSQADIVSSWTAARG